MSCVFSKERKCDILNYATCIYASGITFLDFLLVNGNQNRRYSFMKGWGWKQFKLV